MKNTGREPGATHAFDLATRELLQRYGNSPPSLTLHLYPTHFRFGHQPGLFLRDSPGWSFLACLRDQRLPEDLREVLGGPRFAKGDLSIPFYDGCLIVELHDHRKASASTNAAAAPSSRPMYPARHLDQELHSAGSGHQQEAEEQISVCRIVLWPQEGSLAAEVAKLAPNDPVAALALEGKILALTQPLCLVADPSVCQAANIAWGATMPRPSQASEHQKRKDDQDLINDAREKRMRIMDESYGRSFTPTYAVHFFMPTHTEPWADHLGLSLCSFSRLEMGQQLRESHSPDSSLAMPAPPAPPRSQHPLAQTHFPPAGAGGSSLGANGASSSSSKNAANLSVTIPARKASAPPSKVGSPASMQSSVGNSSAATPAATTTKKKGVNQYTKNRQAKPKKVKGEAASPSNAGTPVDTTGLGAWPTL